MIFKPIILALAGGMILSCSQKGEKLALPSINDGYVNAKYSGAQTSVQGTWGALNCHDPKLFQDDDGTYYVYSTDASIGDFGVKGLQIRKSTDLVHWTCLSDSAIQGNWDKEWTEWVGFTKSGKEPTSWAPTVIKQNGLYYMMHGIITENIMSSKPSAAITLAVASKPEGPFYPAATAAQNDSKILDTFNSLGIKYESSFIVRYSFYEYLHEEFKGANAKKCLNNGMYNGQTGEEEDFAGWLYGFGCIDPEFVTDVATGNLVEFDKNGRKCYALTYGSWKGGIALIYVDSLLLKPVDSNGNVIDFSCDTERGCFGKAIAGGYGAAYEGAQLIFNSDIESYYLFVSMGNLEHEYRVGVGRSASVDGPFYDASGRPMLLDGMNSMQYHSIGSKIKGATQIGKEKPFRCPGGQSILRASDGNVYFACHTRTNFLPGYFFYLQINQLFFNKDGWPVLNVNEYYPLEKRSGPFEMSQVAGEYDVILTERGNKTGKFSGFGYAFPADEINLIDAEPTVSKKININSKGKISGAFKGFIELGEFDERGFQNVKVTLKGKNYNGGKAVFTGVLTLGLDWTLESEEKSPELTFSCLDSSESGEYFMGNRR